MPNPKIDGGSSPRMRGAVPTVSTACLWRGIIPAHAGSSIRMSRERTDSKDHPRACGEQNRILEVCLPVAGSSPRMRGAAHVRGAGRR